MIQDNSVYLSVAEISHHQTAVRRKNDPIRSVRTVPVSGHKGTKQIPVGQIVVDFHIFFILPEPVNPRNQQSVRTLHRMHIGLGDINVAVPIAHTVGVLHVISHRFPFLYALIVYGQLQDSALVEHFGSFAPALIVADKQILFGTVKGNAHVSCYPGFGMHRHIQPFGDLPVAFPHLQETSAGFFICKIGAGQHQIPVPVNFHTVRCTNILRRQ